MNYDYFGIVLLDLATSMARGWGRLIVSRAMPEHWSVRCCISQAVIRDQD